MDDYTKVDSYLEKNLDASLDELKMLAAQPSVAAQNWGMADCASIVSKMLRAASRSDLANRQSSSRLCGA
jgi:hypothetical protein